MWTFGCYAAITNLIVLILIDTLILSDKNAKGFSRFDRNRSLDYFMYLVSLIVLCISEGLDLVVTVSLWHSTKQLSKNKCFVRTLNAPEVMANCSDLVSDLTSEIAVQSPIVTEIYLGKETINVLDQ